MSAQAGVSISCGNRVELAAGSCANTRGGSPLVALHNTRGQADTRHEAEHVAAAHADYSHLFYGDDEPCDLHRAGESCSEVGVPRQILL